jgi:metal-responsive CopG/Arc/MetJ family transcriptional regulator
VAKQRFNFWIDDQLRDGLKRIRERDGVSESEQVRRAIREWIRQKEAAVTPALRGRSAHRRT